MKKFNTKSDSNESLINQYVYMHQTNSEMSIHRIFKVVKYIDDNDYIVENHYYFTIPFNKSCKCFCYNGENKIEFNDDMYIMDNDEYVNTFRMFKENDSKVANSIPLKIIQDK